MRAKTWLWRVLGAMTLLMAPLMASASGGGAISFTGSIVAPQLQLTAGRAPVGARLGAAGGQAERKDSALTLTFSAPPGVAAGVDVALQMNGGAPRDLVAARFVDSGGRVAAARDGHYQVGCHGGVLSLALKYANSTDTRVTVVVSYQ